MNVNFYLSNAYKKGHSINVSVSKIVKGERFFVSTGETIPKKYWDNQKQQVKHTYTESNSINQRLINIKFRIKEHYRNLITNNPEITHTEIEKEIRGLFEIKPDKENNFFQIYDKFNETQKTNNNLATYQKYNTIKNLLLEFSQNCKYDISYNNINLNFYDTFQNYCLVKRKEFKGADNQNLQCYNNNTFKRTLGFIKTFLIWSNERGYSNNNEFKKFKAKGYEKEIITLTENELFQLYNFKFNNEKLERIKDLFCFGCFTGQRYSDIQGLQFTDIQFNIWNLRTQKTRDILQIPLTNYALEIIDKYKSKGLNSLPKISNQKFNEYLKEALQLAGINSLVKQVRYIGNQRIEEIKPKYEIVGTHTARRTFISLSLEKGISTEILMKITGHSDYKTLKGYINISTKAKETELNKVWNNKPDKLKLIKTNKK